MGNSYKDELKNFNTSRRKYRGNFLGNKNNNYGYMNRWQKKKIKKYNTTKKKYRENF